MLACPQPLSPPDAPVGMRPLAEAGTYQDIHAVSSSSAGFYYFSVSSAVRNLKKITSKYFIIKFTKTNVKEKIFSQRKNTHHLTYRETTKNCKDYSSETMQARRQWNNVSNA